MTSVEMKLHVMKWLQYRKNCLCAFTEYRFADVFAINNSGYPIEVEVKVDKRDLANEVKTIRHLLSDKEDHTYRPKWSYKYEKHHSYLINERKEHPRPRYFFFAVPETIIDQAKIWLEGTPYGLVSVKHFALEIKKSDRLSENKYEQADCYNLLRKATNEIVALREKVQEYDKRELHPLISVPTVEVDHRTQLVRSVIHRVEHKQPNADVQRRVLANPGHMQEIPNGTDHSQT